MRLERLNYNKIKIFLTFDDLVERGLSKEDLWQDIPKVHQLFRDMIDEANDELGFIADGPISVEVYSLQAQGMVIIVTKDEGYQDEEEDFLDDYIELQVTLDESEEILYEFVSFEDIISLIPIVNRLKIQGGNLYSLNGVYYLQLREDELNGYPVEDFVSILSEYGYPATITVHRIQEYGKKLMENSAFRDLNTYFGNEPKE